jgi:hypothetical protein
MTTLSDERHSERVPTKRGQDVVADVGCVDTEHDVRHPPNLVGARMCSIGKASARLLRSGILRWTHAGSP